MPKLARSVCLLLATNLYILAGARLHGGELGEAQDHNLREACRKQVAGRYLVLYDGREKNQQLATYLGEKIKDLQAALVSANRKLGHVNAALSKAAFDSEHNAQRIALEERVKSLQAALTSQQELLAKAEVAAQQAQTELTQFEGRLHKVFKIEALTGRGVGYKFQVVYRGSCPPYRFSCPLSRDDAKDLRSMFTDADRPEVCGKYADFLQW